MIKIHGLTVRADLKDTLLMQGVDGTIPLYIRHWVIKKEVE